MKNIVIQGLGYVGLAMMTFCAGAKKEKQTPTNLYSSKVLLQSPNSRSDEDRMFESSDVKLFELTQKAPSSKDIQ